MAMANMTEIDSSRLALDSSQDSNVKMFAQRMIDDHTQAQQDLSSLAASKAVTLPSHLDATHQKMIDELKEKSGTDFDKAYVDDQIAGHKEAISADQDEANNGNDPQERALADRLLPTLNMHLSMAEKLQNGSGGM
jgi:putative membrane protein